MDQGRWGSGRTVAVARLVSLIVMRLRPKPPTVHCLLFTAYFLLRLRSRPIPPNPPTRARRDEGSGMGVSR